MIERWIVLAGEEGGPASNKMGGIWDVIDAEAVTLGKLASQGIIERGLKILVLGPNYPTSGSDWNTGKNRSRGYRDSRGCRWALSLIAS